MAGNPPQAPSLSKVRVREATIDDATGYVTAMLAGYEVDHQFVYRYPYRKQYPQDAHDASAAVFRASIDNPNTIPLVAELPKAGPDGEPTGEWIVVAVATWEWKSLADVENETHPTGFSTADSPRRDMDPQRQKVFIDAITAAEKRNFGAEWGQRRIELADLACHTDFQRRGAGQALTAWGLQKASEQGLPVMLTASPLGRLVYKKLGFRDLEYVECGVEGEEERVGTWVMVWTPEGWKAPSGEGSM